MFKKMLFARLGAATVITAFGLAACGNDSSSGSNQCEALTPECGYTVEDLCHTYHIERYCPEQGSSSVEESSSSRSQEQCVHMPHMDPGEEIVYQIPICAQEEEGTMQPDCNTDDVYVCRDGRWTASQIETCSHITDNDCVISQGCSLTPCMSGTVTVDCARHAEYTCEGGTWTLSIPSEGKSCLAEGDIQNVWGEQAGGKSNTYVPYQCKDGKWAEFYPASSDG